MAQWVAVFCAAVWALICLYLSIAERPRANLDVDAPAFKLYRNLSANGVPFLIALIFVGAGSGIYAWTENRVTDFVVGSLILLLMFPLSSIFVMPLSRSMMTSSTTDVGDAIKSLFRRWWLVHILRTLLAVTATGFFLRGLLV